MLIIKSMHNQGKIGFAQLQGQSSQRKGHNIVVAMELTHHTTADQPSDCVHHPTNILATGEINN